MKSLVRNDLRWAWQLALFGTLLHLLIQFGEYSVGQIWILPINKYIEVSLGFHAVAAMIVGAWALLLDDLVGTREYLRHRPQSDRRIFWARHLVGLAVVASWVLLVPTLHLLGSALFSPDAPLIDRSRWFLLVAQGAPAFFYYALAVFLISCARTAVGGVFLAAAVGGILWRPIWLAVVEGPPWAVGSTFGLCLALTPVLLLLAEQNQRMAPDRDRPWNQRRLAGAGTGLIVLTIVASALLLTFTQLVSRLVLMEVYPEVVERDRGATLAFSLSLRGYRRVDQRHQRQELLPGQRQVLFNSRDFQRGEPAPARDDNPVFDAPSAGIGQIPYGVSRAGGRVFRYLHLGLQQWGPARYTYLGQDGYVYLYWLAERPDDRPRMWRLGKGADGTPFSTRAKVLDVREPDPVLVEDGELWFLQADRQQPSLVRLPLPDQDRFVERVPVNRIRLTTRERLPDYPPLVVQGQRGRYLWREDRFVTLDPAGTDTALRGFELVNSKPPIDARRVGATGLQVSLTAPDGSTFQHLYQPHTLWEQAMAIGLRGSTLLRPPLTTVPGLFAEPQLAEQLGPALLIDRAVLLGDRAALVGNLMLSLLLAAFTFWRVGRLGAPRARRVYWTVAVLLGGVPALLCHLLVERKRAWQPMPAEPAGRPAPAGLLLQTS